MKILPFSKDYSAQAAALFIRNYETQRLATPVLPGLMSDQNRVEAMLSVSFDAASGLVVIENGQICAYLCWFLVDHFRGTARKGAYAPEWGHACMRTDKARDYQALYRAAGERWAAAGCQVHAITLLAQDYPAEKCWYWNGFGLTVVDAIRPMLPLENSHNTRLTIRKAAPADAEALTRLDAEHWRHYSQSPIFMASRTGKSVAENMEFLTHPKNRIWVAQDDGELVGFIRFEGYDFNSASILESEEAVTITGAYVCPAYRGQKLAPALLNAALRDYQSMGLGYCAVNFESFNPEAAAFWMRYFEPVCFSLVRIPET